MKEVQDLQEHLWNKMKKTNIIILVAFLVIISGCQTKPPVTTTQNNQFNEPVLDQIYSSKGVLQIINTQDNYVTIDHEEIPGFMDAMVMSFEPQSLSLLQGLEEGDKVEFKIKSNKLKSKVVLFEIKKITVTPPPPPVTGMNVKEIEIEGDDSGIYPSTITVNKNDKVKITFKVKQQGVYYGGLDFTSDYFSTGTIKPGEQKTIEFIADKTFTFISYWPATSVEKARGQIIVN